MFEGSGRIRTYSDIKFIKRGLRWSIWNLWSFFLKSRRFISTHNCHLERSMCKTVLVLFDYFRKLLPKIVVDSMGWTLRDCFISESETAKQASLQAKRGPEASLVKISTRCDWEIATAWRYRDTSSMSPLEQETCWIVFKVPHRNISEWDATWIPVLASFSKFSRVENGILWKHY